MKNILILFILISYNAFTYNFVSIINDYRIANGKHPIKQNNQLDRALAKMAKMYAHKGYIDYEYISDANLNITDYSIVYTYGFTSSSSLVNFCVHNDNFLNNYDYASVAVYKIENYNYVVAGVFNGINYDDEVNEVYDLITENRNNNGAITKLKRDKNLEKMAMARAKELFEKYSHTRPNGKEFYTIMEDLNIENYWNGNGENIASGYKNAKEVMKAWMESKGHRENILDKRYTSVGVGLYVKNGKAYWVQIFGIDNPKYKDTDTEYQDNNNSTYDSYKNYDEYGDNYKNDSLY
ncbi:hypothetical protein Bint_1109 [Brachyspira intermedia PWS/A]|uniref:SCP domain-containing protein n=1 Tax=Brachyspira intermedia (strain ATCC 51140 / PWS/A) TaxID=1045858 RepID=G0EMP4_BRAIP|nr:CAP domain-containing protein [Brachyspira intermedia]AEM21732.1 hypothetical protein Bint_1109 [Brachyspira intermedia PWS/A]